MTFGCGRVHFTNLTDAQADGQGIDTSGFVSPVASYPLNEGTGQIANRTGGPPHGVLGATVASEPNDPTWVQGHAGTALAFDSTDDRVLIPYATTGFLQGFVIHDAITMSAWIQPMLPATGFRVVFEIGGETNGAALGLTDTGRVRFTLRYSLGAPNVKTLDSAFVLAATGAWYYVAATHDTAGTSIRIYDDTGALLDLASAPGPFAWRTGTDGIAIGDNPDDNSGLRGLSMPGPEPFSGLVDEVRIYDIAITEPQIEADLVTPLP